MIIKTNAFVLLSRAAQVIDKIITAERTVEKKKQSRIEAVRVKGQRITIGEEQTIPCFQPASPPEPPTPQGLTK